MSEKYISKRKLILEGQQLFSEIRSEFISISNRETPRYHRDVEEIYLAIALFSHRQEEVLRDG